MLNAEEIKRVGTPLYVYEKGIIERKIREFKEAFTDFNLLYSPKANPYPKIIELMVQNEVGMDAASVNEVLLGEEYHQKEIYYSSPGKTTEDIQAVLDKCVIIADSLGEISRINSCATKKTKIGVRLNVDNALIQKSKYEIMGGAKSKFGISYHDFTHSSQKIKEYKNIEIVGIHLYFGSQILDYDIIANNFDIIAKTALSLKNIEFINFGGGFGVPYEEEDVPLCLKKLYKCVIKSENVCKVLESDIKCNVELGRFLCAQAGMYYTEVVDIKESEGSKYAIVKGGINSFFRPVFTKQRHNIVQLSKRDGEECYIVAGSMCTPIDEYGTFKLHTLKEGDILGFINGGAYGYSMSMLKFISHKEPSVFWKDK